jgi:hypothetical protein
MRVVTAFAVAALLAGGTSSALAKTKPKPKPVAAPAAKPPAAPRADVSRFPDGWRADLGLDGLLLGWALPRQHDGRRVLHLLVGPKSDDAASGAPACSVNDRARASRREARLYRWSSASPERLEAEGSGLPCGALDAADLDGDAQDELLLSHDGGIDLLSPSAGGAAVVRPLLAEPSFGVSCCGPRLAWDDASTQDPVVRRETPGAFRSYRLGADGHLVLASEIELPQTVAAAAERVTISSPPVLAIGRWAPGRMVFATEPQPLGQRRLRTLFLDPDGPREGQSVESWALFPSAERVVDSGFSLLNGTPVLIVTTTSGDKLSLLGEKVLRVYPLAGDRTRAGDAPLFSATTAINLWQEASPVVVDLDRDGRDDLVLAYWKGLKNAIAALEVYRGGTAPILAKSGTTSFDVEGGAKGFIDFGSDLDGDGRPDLLLRAHGELLVYPGVAASRALGKPVESRPSRRIAVPADLPDAQGTEFSMGTAGFQISRSAGGLGKPHLVDLDGDGRPEVLFAGAGAGPAARVVVVFVRGTSALAPSSTIVSDATRGR